MASVELDTVTAPPLPMDRLFKTFSVALGLPMLICSVLVSPAAAETVRLLMVSALVFVAVSLSINTVLELAFVMSTAFWLTSGRTANDQLVGTRQKELVGSIQLFVWAAAANAKTKPRQPNRLPMVRVDRIGLIHRHSTEE